MSSAVDDIEVYTVRYEDKKKAVIDCLKMGRGFSIRELRECASKRYAISEKTVSRILSELRSERKVVNVNKKWFLVDVLYAKLTP